MAIEIKVNKPSTENKVTPPPLPPELTGKVKDSNGNVVDHHTRPRVDIKQPSVTKPVLSSEERGEEYEEPVPEFYTKVRTYSNPNLPPDLQARRTLLTGLPSYFHYYTPEFLGENAFTELRARSFTTFDLFNIYKARNTQDKSLLLDTVASTIDQPLHLLTMGDLRFLLFHLRLNSYPKSPLQVIWKCGSCEERYRVKNNINPSVALPFNVETEIAYYNLDRVMKSNIKIHDLPKARHIPPQLEVPRVAQFLAYSHYMELYPWAEKLATAALYVKADKEFVKEGIDLLSFQAKLDTLNYSPDSMNLLSDAETLAILLHHGVEDSIRVRCQKEGCGRQYNISLSTDFLSFFP